MRRYAFALLIVASPISAIAGTLSKEGSYDYISCSSGVSTPIRFSKTHTASNFELTGINRSNIPGGIFDKTSFHCVGMTASLDGKQTGLTLCEAIDADGDKWLANLSTADGKTTRTIVAGTGKYEGIVTEQTAYEPLGPFPAIKDGTLQFCNRQTGTYKLK